MNSKLAALAPELDVKVSGCPNGCGQHHIASLGFQGSVRKVAGKAIPQYFVMVGGGATDTGAHFGKVVAKIPVNRLTTAVERLLDLYKAQRLSTDENLGAFFRRIPPAAATAATAGMRCGSTPTTRAGTTSAATEG